MGKGSSSTTYSQRPLTSEEKAVLQQQADYLATMKPVTSQLVGIAQNDLNTMFTPDWSQLYNQTMNNVQNITSEYGQLQSGIIPKAFEDAQQAYMNRTYENALGNKLAALSKKGVVDSSRYNTAVNDIQQNLASEMSKNYTNNFNTYANLLSNKANLATLPMTAAAQAANESMKRPLGLIGAAQGNADRINQALNTTSNMMSNATTATTTTHGGDLFGSLLGIGGQIGSALIMCFGKGTRILTDYGSIPIEELQVGDTVVAKEGVEKVVEVISTGKQPIISVYAGDYVVNVTPTQPFFTREGQKPITDIYEGDEILTASGFEKVSEINETGEIAETFDMLVTGSGTFYADGVCVEGFTKEELQTAKEALAQAEVTE